MIKFLIVGVLNTIVGTAIMFIAYNKLHFNYWISSSLNYILASILSYFLNKYFTFKNKDKGFKPVVKFAINIMICYLVSYGIAKPLISLFLSDYTQTIRDNGAMLVGMCLFVISNYFGQRYFAFKNKFD